MFGYNPNYIAQKFKDETDQTIGAFIRDAKISEAKSEQKYSTLSLSDITEQLSFSSQSFFTYTFRQVTGVTPGQYREQAEA
jgi:AraC-like DNA-binding protein